MTFAFSPTQVDLLYLKMQLSEWITERVWGRNNAVSAYHGMQADINDFSLFDLVTQVNVSVSGGLEGVLVAGAPAPPVAAEIEAPQVEISLETIFYKSTHINGIMQSFAPADFPPFIWDFIVYVRELKGGFYIQNCAPQRMTLQFSQGQIATLTVTFVSNYMVFLPQNSIVYGGGRAQIEDFLPAANFSSVLAVTPEADELSLKVTNMNLTVTNSISLDHAMPFEPFSDEYSKVRRAPRLFSFGFQTMDVSVTALAPENVLHSINQFPVPAKQVAIQCYDTTMNNLIGELNFSGKFVDWRVNITPQNIVNIDWRQVIAGTPLWSYTPAP